MQSGWKHEVSFVRSHDVLPCRVVSTYPTQTPCCYCGCSVFFHPSFFLLPFPLFHRIFLLVIPHWKQCNRLQTLTPRAEWSQFAVEHYVSEIWPKIKKLQPLLVLHPNNQCEAVGQTACGLEQAVSLEHCSEAVCTLALRASQRGAGPADTLERSHLSNSGRTPFRKKLYNQLYFIAETCCGERCLRWCSGLHRQFFARLLRLQRLRISQNGHWLVVISASESAPCCMPYIAVLYFPAQVLIVGYRGDADVAARPSLLIVSTYISEVS